MRLSRAFSAGSSFWYFRKKATPSSEGAGAQFLADLGVGDMVLLTNSHLTLVALAGYGLKIVSQRRI